MRFRFTWKGAEMVREDGGGRNIRVFVYGSLMRGFHNHAAYLGRARFLGPVATRPLYTLHSMGAFPAMVEGGTTPVRGELWAVNARELQAMDRLEGHPRFYARKPVALDGGGEAWGYVLPAESALGRPVVPTGDWRRRG